MESIVLSMSLYPTFCCTMLCYASLVCTSDVKVFGFSLGFSESGGLSYFLKENLLLIFLGVFVLIFYTIVCFCMSESQDPAIHGLCSSGILLFLLFYIYNCNVFSFLYVIVHANRLVGCVEQHSLCNII